MSLLDVKSKASSCACPVMMMTELCGWSNCRAIHSLSRLYLYRRQDPKSEPRIHSSSRTSKLHPSSQGRTPELHNNRRFSLLHRSINDLPRANSVLHTG